MLRLTLCSPAQTLVPISPIPPNPLFSNIPTPISSSSAPVTPLGKTSESPSLSSLSLMNLDDHGDIPAPMSDSLLSKRKASVEDGISSIEKKAKLASKEKETPKDKDKDKDKEKDKEKEKEKDKKDKKRKSKDREKEKRKRDTEDGAPSKVNTNIVQGKSQFYNSLLEHQLRLFLI